MLHGGAVRDSFPWGDMLHIITDTTYLVKGDFVNIFAAFALPRKPFIKVLFSRIFLKLGLTKYIIYDIIKT